MTFANMVYISDFRVGFHKLRLVKIFIVQRRSFIVNNVFDFYENILTELVTTLRIS